MPARPTISIIIVNWNSKDFLRKCLTSFFTHCRSVPAEIIVVDGASFDGCGEMLASEFPSVVFIQSPDNVGFARANNLGARSAQGKYLLLLNPDTLFSEDSIQIMLDGLESLPQAGAVGCRLLNADGTLQTTSIMTFPTILNQVFDSEYLRSRFRDWKLWGVAALYAQPQRAAEVEVISGACIFIRREVFEKVGGFSEQYFMYSEDVDLCRKIQQAGQPAYYHPGTSLIHYGGGSSDQAVSNFSTVMMRYSTCLYLQLNHGTAKAVAYRGAMALTALVRLLAIAPLGLFGNRIVRHASNSMKKWYAVLRWSLGLAAIRAVLPAGKSNGSAPETVI